MRNESFPSESGPNLAKIVVTFLSGETPIRSTLLEGLLLVTNERKTNGFFSKCSEEKEPERRDSCGRPTR